MQTIQLWIKLTMPGLISLLLLAGCIKEEILQPPAESAQVESQPTHSLPSKPSKPAVIPPKILCGVELQSDVLKEAQAYYVKAERLYNNNEISLAKKALELSTCLNPKHKKSHDLLNLLNKTFP